MIRRATIAGLALVVLTALVWQLSILGTASAVAQQPGGQQPAASRPAQKQATAQPTSQPTTQATQPAQGKLVVQAEPRAQQGQARLGAAPPGTHGLPGMPPVLPRDQIEKLIPPEEREALGLPEPTWVKQHGKVHPDVREILKTAQMPWVHFKGWEPDSCVGTAYVAVYLRHEQPGGREPADNRASFRESQSRVLSRLTAAQFRTVFLFTTKPAMLGYVNRDGLATLEEDADVVAIGLDESPVPTPPPPTDEQGLEQSTGQRSAQLDTNTESSKIEPAAYEALKASKDGYICVVITLTRPPTWASLANTDRDAISRDTENRVLGRLTADEFRIRYRRGFLSGYVNAGGLVKLNKDPDVFGVTLNRRLRVLD